MFPILAILTLRWGTLLLLLPLLLPLLLLQ